MGFLRYSARLGRAARLVLAVAGALLAVAVLPAVSSAALSWTGPMATDTVGNGPALDAVACISTSSCTALTTSGGAVAFNPQSVTPVNPTAVDPSVPTGVSCPVGGRCVAVDFSGNEVTFGGSTVSIDPGQALTAVSCPSASSCVAVDTGGNEVTFTPGATSGSTRHSVDSNQVLTAVSCPSASECVAVDTGRNETTFDPTTGSSSNSALPNIGASSQLSAISCPSTSQCLAFDSTGTETSFNPQAASSGYNIIQLDPGQSIIASTCESSSECTVLDGGGGEITAPPITKAPRVVVDPSQTASALSCAAANSCVAVTGQGREITFNPATGSVGSPILTDSAPAYSGVACASPAQCTGVDQSGDIATFNPQTGITGATGAVDPGSNLVNAIACPSSTECTVIDLNGTEVTFNPQSPGSPSSKQFVKGHPLLAISCPSASQCTAVDDDRDEITFNPQNPAGATYALLSTPAGTPLNGVACPSTTQCTAVDGSGDAVTFNPRAPGQPAAHPVLPNGASGVACPTTGECVAIDPSGLTATFAPSAPQYVHMNTVSSSSPTGLACLTATYCVVSDSAGHGVEFDPHGVGATATRSVGTSSSITGLACPSAQECVAVDTGGHAYTARGQLPPLPGASGAPLIHGRAVQGDRLTATTGGWTNAPTSYAPQWQRCSARAKDCRAIAGATGQAYVPGRADVGHRLRMLELAANQAGYGPLQYAKLTPAIVGTPRMTRPTLTDSRPSRAALSFTLTAGRPGPKLRTLVITLPAGVAFSTRTQHHNPIAGLSVTSGGRRLRAAARTVAHRLRITLVRAVASVRVVLRAPSLTVRSTLSHRLRARRVTDLTLRVTLSGPGADNLSTTTRWKAR